MTSMIDKPRSTKAESFFRHNGTTDHGTKGNPGRDKGDYEYTTAAKRAALEIIHDDEFYSTDEAEFAVDDLVSSPLMPYDADTHSLNRTEFEELKDTYPNYLDVSELFGVYLGEFRKGELDIDDLVGYYQLELQRQTGLMPTYEDAESLLYDLLVAEPTEYEDEKENTSQYMPVYFSEAEVGIQSLRAKRKANEQAATLDPAYAEDDTEDYYETGRSVYKVPVTQEDRKRNY